MRSLRPVLEHVLVKLKHSPGRDRKKNLPPNENVFYFVDTARHHRWMTPA